EANVSVWDVKTAKRLYSRGVGSGRAILAFSPGGELLAAVGQSSLLWDINSGGEALSLPAGKLAYASAAAFSPDGRVLAVAYHTPNSGEEPEVVLWELATGKARARLKGHKHGIASLAFSPDGRTLATGGDDTTILLWDISGGWVPATRA